jgi:hypothetical protein
MSDWANMGMGGASGFVGIMLGWLGCKSKIDTLEKRMDTLSATVRYKDTSEALHKALNERLAGIEDMQKEMRDDIKQLLPKGK